MLILAIFSDNLHIFSVDSGTFVYGDPYLQMVFVCIW
jgi:hypothetical protein